MRFHDPQALALLVFPLLLLALLVYRHHRRTGLLRLSDVATLVAASGGKRAPRRLLAPELLKTMGLMLLVVALARPQFGTVREESKRLGVDIFLCLDVSGSMAAEDLKPNRLEAAKKVAADFISMAGSNRLGMILFAGKPMTLLPLSADYGVLVEHVRRIRLEEVPFPGTNVGDSIAMAVYHLEKEQTKSKVVVLVTDGESNTGYADPLAAAKIAKEKGVRVYTIGVGSEGGAPIPVNTGYGRYYARDENGQLLMPKIDAVTLKAVAEHTGGQFFRATDERALARVFETIGKLEKSEVRTSRTVVYSEQSHVFSLLAFGLLAAAILLESGPMRRLE